MFTPVVFLDKDGTLIEDVPYNANPDKIRLTSGAAEGIAQLAANGYCFIIVSNQPGLALQRFSRQDLAQVHWRINLMLNELGALLLDFYYCPHSPESLCCCRKPSPGLILKAIAEHNIQVENSWFIGDILDDIEAGSRAGLRTVLLNNGHETVWQRGEFRVPTAIAADFKEAAEHILLNSGSCHVG